VSGIAIEERVVRVCEEVLAAQKYVTAIDVLTGLGWLPWNRVDEWRQGRVPYLEQQVGAGLGKVSTAMQSFRSWATGRGLLPRETGYVARTRDRRQLRFSISDNPEIELAYRTHWVSPELSEAKRRRLAEQQTKPPDLVVISPIHDWTCARCSGTGDFLLMEDDNPLCMRCARLDHLVFLGAGEPGLTRRAHRASNLTAVVVRFSRSRQRYERQGLLVEPAALATAEAGPA
jgi:hypothetical protein